MGPDHEVAQEHERVGDAKKLFSQICEAVGVYSWNYEVNDTLVVLVLELEAKINKILIEFQDEGHNEEEGEIFKNNILRLVEQTSLGALSPSQDLQSNLHRRIANIDEVLSLQLQVIIEAPPFQALESSWQGLHYLVNEIESNETLKIKILNLSKVELLKDFHKSPEIDQTALFKKVYDEEFGTFGGEPFGCLIVDFYFDSGPQDIELLRFISDVGASALAPVITGVAPTFFGIETWTELNPTFNPDWFFTSSGYSLWRDLCVGEDTAFLFLIMPKMRYVQKQRINQSRRFAYKFEEEHPVYINASYGLAEIICQTFQRSQWFAPLIGEKHGCIVGRKGDAVQTGQNENQYTLSMEIDISPDLASRLRSIGLTGVVKHASQARHYFQEIRPVGWWCTERVEQQSGWAWDLSILLCGSLFVHHVRRFCRYIGPRACDDQGEPILTRLNQWLMKYIHSDVFPYTQKPCQPLAAGKFSLFREYRLSHQDLRVLLEISPAYQFPTPYKEIQFLIRLPGITEKPLWSSQDVEEIFPNQNILVFTDLDNRENENSDFCQIFHETLRSHYWSNKDKWKVPISIPNKLLGEGILDLELCFNTLEDFDPEKVGEQVDCIKKAFHERGHLVALALFLDLVPLRREVLATYMKRPGGIEALTIQMEAYVDLARNDWHAPLSPFIYENSSTVLKGTLREWLPSSGISLKQFKEEGIGAYLLTFSRWIQKYSEFAQIPPTECLLAILEKIDEMINAQLNCILNHPDVRRVEATFRGMNYLVTRLMQEAPRKNTDCEQKAIKKHGMIRTKFLNISKEKFLGIFRSNPIPDGYYSSPRSLGSGKSLRQNILDEIGICHASMAGLADAECLCVILDYEFDLDSKELKDLDEILKISYYSKVPFLLAVSPNFFGVSSWDKFAGIQSISRLMEKPEYDDWHSFIQKRGEENLILSLPGFPCRDREQNSDLWRRKKDAIGVFQFREDATKLEGSRELFANPGYVIAAELGLSIQKMKHYSLREIDRAQCKPIKVGVTIPSGEQVLGSLARHFSGGVSNELQTHGLTSIMLGKINIFIYSSIEDT